MENTSEKTNGYRQSAARIFGMAKADLADNMQEHDMGAIIWDNSTAGFHFLPEIVVRDKDNKPETVRVTGLYLFGDTIYLIEEGKSGVSVDHFYNPDVDVKPTVVTLSADRALKDLGDPSRHPGYTTQGSLEEWLAIADCYFEALNES